MRIPNISLPRRGKTNTLDLVNWHKHPFAVPVITFMVLFFVSLISFVVLNGQTIGASDSRVVHLYVDGQSRIIPTRAQTVQQVLEKAGIELHEGDVTEPATDSLIVNQDFNINVYRAKPVTIVDNKGQKVTKKLVSSTPSDTAKRAGVMVYPEDKVTVAAPDEALKDGVLGDQIVIDRATPTNINLYGNSITARTHAKTVGELLTERGVKPLDGDTVQPARDTPITENTQIFITRFGKQLATSEEAIPVPVEKTKDPNLLAGTSKVTEPGAPGKKIVTYEIELTNGKETSRKPIQEVIAVQPVKQVVSEGTKVVISNPSANVELGRQIAAELGYSDQFYCIYNVFERESHWNHLAGNASGAYGIPQALPGSKMGAGWQTDPAVQIRWGINYMKNRYGSPCGAWQHWQISHNY